MEFEYKFKPYDSFKIGDSCSFSHTFTSDEVLAFARLTGDENPIHTDEEFARSTMFGKRLVHGMFINSVCAKGIAPFVGTASINIGQSWKCPAPSFIGDTITYEIKVIGLNDEKHELTLELKGTKQDGTVVLMSTNPVRIMDKKKS